MNKRIEKLIEQCTVQNFSDCTGGFETFDKEKFALLIVRECLSYAKDGDLDFMKFMIKKNFGVEE